MKKLLMLILALAVMATLLLPMAAPQAAEYAADLSVDSAVRVDEFHGKVHVEYDDLGQVIEDTRWVYYDYLTGSLDATVDGREYRGISLETLRNILSEQLGERAYCMVSYDTDSGFDQSAEDPWQVGDTFTVQLGFVDANNLPLTPVIPVTFTLAETAIEKITAEDVTFYEYEKWKVPTLTVHYSDGTSRQVGKDEFAFQISYPDGTPEGVGEYEVKAEVGEAVKFPVTFRVTVLPTPTSGMLGEKVMWTYEKDSETLIISGEGSATADAQQSWNQLFTWHRPRYVMVEEGVDALFDGIFHYGYALEEIRLPSTLKELPTAFLGWNGPSEDAPALAGEHYKGMTRICLPEGMTSLTTSAFYLCWGISEFHLPASLVELDLDALCHVAYLRQEMGLEPLKTTIYFAGTQKQWDEMKHVQGNRAYPTGLSEKELEELLSTFEVVCTASEDVESIVISPVAADRIAQAGEALQLKLPDAVLSFDNKAVESIVSQLGTAPVTVVAAQQEKAGLNAAQQAALTGQQIHGLLSLEAYAGENQITRFGGGTVTVSIPFALPEGKTGEDFRVVYVAEDGTLTPMPTAYAGGKLLFETTHFSCYAVAENRVSTPSVPTTGDVPAYALLMAVAAAGAALWLLRSRKED